MRGSRAGRYAPAPAARDHPRMRGEQLRKMFRKAMSRGSPPHARGAARNCEKVCPGHRITPACAGSSRPSQWNFFRGWDHPRMRGEQGPADCGGTGIPGSPPHARGAVTRDSDLERTDRITPACAGSRGLYPPFFLRWWDHPRMRGEQDPGAAEPALRVGSPPHARGAAWLHTFQPGLPGITPACAGSSYWVRWLHRGGRDHPRMRGEQYGRSR